MNCPTQSSTVNIVMKSSFLEKKSKFGLRLQQTFVETLDTSEWRRRNVAKTFKRATILKVFLKYTVMFQVRVPIFSEELLEPVY